MKELTEEWIKANCPHCDREGWAFEFLIEEHTHFTFLCDTHPLIEGHLLIIPKRHVSCIAEYTAEELVEFKALYKRLSDWIAKTYGGVATFEHGIMGQTVFHSHVHLMPFTGTPSQIVPEGTTYLEPINSLEELSTIYKRDGKYLYFSIQGSQWVVDLSIGAPRFFRDRFAKAFGVPERANWKTTRQNPELLSCGHTENRIFIHKFQNLGRIPI